MPWDTNFAEQDHKDRHNELVKEHHRSQRYLLFFGLFCCLTILLPDSALIVSDRSIHMPGFNVPISLYHFIPIASVILIALNIHVQALQSQRLKSARTGSAAVYDVALFHLPGPLARFLGGLISYCIVPLTLVAMTYTKALHEWLLGGIMFAVTVVVTLCLACLFHQRRLLATSPSVSRIKRWRWVAPYVGIACILFLPLFTISSVETNAKMEEKRKELNGPPRWATGSPDSAQRNGNEEKNTSIVVYMTWRISTPYEIFLKKWMVRPLNLAYADLSGASLPGFYLEGADLRYANLQGARLPLADLRKANLLKANLKGAHLYRADLTNAELSWADLEGASLYKAELNEAWLRGADLEGANLSRAKLFEAKLPNADLSGTRLKSACLLGADLEGAKLDGADLDGALLREELGKANCPDLEGAQFQNADRRGTRPEGGANIYLLTAPEGDFGSISTGSPVYTKGRKVGHVLSIESHRDSSANGPRLNILLKNAVLLESAFYVILAKHGKAPEDGIAFEEPLSPVGFAKKYHQFSLHRNLVDGRAPTVHYKVNHDTSVHGLEVGAPVKLSGIEVGDVHGIDLTPKEDGKPQVTITIRVMERLGRGDAMSSREIMCGLRARLKPISPTHPQLFVDLGPDDVSHSGTGKVDCTPGAQAQDRTPSRGLENQG